MNKGLYFILLCILQNCSFGLSQEIDSVFLPVKYEGQWRFIDTSGNLRSQTNYYDTVLTLKLSFGDFYALKSNGRYIIYNTSLSPQYDLGFDTIIYNKYLAVAKVDEKYFLFSRTNEDNSNTKLLVTPLTLDADSIYLFEKYIFYYRNGLMGLQYGKKMKIDCIYDRIMPLSNTNALAIENSNFLVLKDERFGLIDSNGKTLLKTEYESIQRFDYDCYRVKKGNYKYYNKELNLLIDPHQGEIVFYDNRHWKIYFSNNGISNFYIDGKLFNAGYDDYFLANGLGDIVVRKNGKIGLIDKNKNVLIPCQFDQLEEIRQGYFRYFLNDHCGLIKRNGKILTEASYHNIISTEIPNIKNFIIIRNNLSGVMNEIGTEIIPIKYDYITDQVTYFQIQHKGKFGIADLKGKLFMKVEFVWVEALIEFNDAKMVIPSAYVGKKDSELHLFNINGQISRAPGTKFQFSNNCVKWYGKSFIDVHVLGENGLEESYTRYEGTPSMVIEEKPRQFIYETQAKHPFSIVIENQILGKSGLRFFCKAGYAVAPAFYRISMDKFNTYNVAEIKRPSQSISLPNNLEYTADFVGRILSLDEGLIDDEEVIGSELLRFEYRGSNSSSQFKWNLGGTISAVSETNNEISSLKNIHYVENVGDYYRRMLIGDNPVICAIADADISLFDYWQFINLHQNLNFANKETALLTLNPRLGIKFEGAHWKVVKDNQPLDAENHVKKFETKTKFESLQLAEPSNNNLFYAKESMQFTGSLVDLHSDSIYMEGISNFLGMNDGFIYYEKNDLQGAIIDVENPENYIQNEDLTSNFSKGLLIYMNKDTYGVKRMNQKVVIPPIYEEIKFLGMNKLALKSKLGWKICDSEGKFVTERIYDSIYEFTNEYSLGYASGKYDLLNRNGEIIQTMNGKCSYVKNHLFFLQQIDGKSYFRNAKGAKVDSIFTGETIIYNQWIQGKNKRGKTYLRSIGGKNCLVHNSNSIKKWGSILVLRNGNSIQFLDSIGHEIIAKGEKINFYGNRFISCKTGKKVQIFNGNGVQIFSGSGCKEIVPYDDLLFIQFSNSGYFINSEGLKIDADSSSKPKVKLNIPSGLILQEFDEIKQVHSYFLVKKNGLWGVANNSGNILLPCKYSQITQVDSNYFKIPSRNKIYVTNSSLKPFFLESYDNINTILNIFQVNKSGSIGYRTQEGKWIWKP